MKDGCIEEHSSPPFCVNPLTVADGKKLQLVIDLRHVNQCLIVPKFKYEDLRSLAQVVDQGHWFFTWDLKSGYHHVSINRDHQQYLGFACRFGLITRYFTFRVLPFGLSSACFCFTKMLRPLVKCWRIMGHNSFVYLDDGVGSQPDKCSVQAASMIQRKDLRASGFVVNEQKSQWTPRQIGEWLGFIINIIKMQFQNSETKVAKFKAQLNAAIQDGFITFRKLARIAGFVNSMSLAVGPISRLLTRQMYFAIESKPAWDHLLCISDSLLEELKFWYLNIECFNGYSIKAPLVSSIVIFTDASEMAFGGFSACLDGSPVSCMWQPGDLRTSSTYRELKAICFVLLSFVDKLYNKNVKVFTDSQTAARIVVVGISKPHLQLLAMDIFQLCLANHIVLDILWIPREENERADLLSRFIDKDDWSVNPSIFQIVNAKWGPHTFDRFASYYNAQLPRFNSKFAAPGSDGVDALAQNWSKENNWICPLVSLIVLSVRKLKRVPG